MKSMAHALRARIHLGIGLVAVCNSAALAAWGGGGGAMTTAFRPAAHSPLPRP
jgi:hypothetical protein